MYVPVLRKAVTFTNLSSIAVAICTIVSFDKSSVNHLANRRCLYRSFHLGFAAKDDTQINLYHSTLPPYFVYSGIFQALCCNTPRTFGAASFARIWWRSFLAVGLQYGLFIRFILIGCHQIHNATTGSFLKIGQKFLNVFCCAFARYNADYQTMLRIISYMIPVVSLLTVSRLIVITVFFFLAHKSPFLVKLHLSGFGGKTPPTHREAPWHALRLPRHNVLPYLDVLAQDGWSYVRHNLLRYALTERPFFPQAVAARTAVCLFVRKIASCMFGSIAAGYGYFCRTSRTQSDYSRRVFQNPGIFYSDNRILKELALSCLQNVNCLWDTTYPSFQTSARQHKNIQY